MQARLRAMLEGREPGWPGRLLRLGLSPAGMVYGYAAAARRALFERNLFCRQRPSVPVISVGNLTAGGTGKTPFVAMLCRMLKSLGRNPAVLLRGYGSADPAKADEALLYARLLPGVGVYPGANRAVSGLRAVADGFDVLVLDDGFQHLRLMRDMDIVLLDATCPFGGGMPLPAGMLRERPVTLSRADLVCLTRTDQVSAGTLELIQERIRLNARNVPVMHCIHRPSRLATLAGEVLSLEGLQGLQVAALSGIGRPDVFASTLRDLGAEVCAAVNFADHQVYTQAGVRSALARLERQWTPVVTEKDAVKLEGVLEPQERQRILVLGVEMRLSGMPQLRERVMQALADAPRL